ncbi:helix-turn-helix domain-containing protein [Lysobacter sp. ISL-50]|uniref:helix-turn-helix transcriptional regulator n=1 Tax=unclassified Lysobacter TaxID=2635362 RepID=UPI001BE86E6A|nr:helix-turn-helix domain-containing protein [Lysobacter sp. ISL-42]MBT2749972.1 helix-turn-helix domain-containing protein [Lysobacter sp. ISL-50]MBT2781300.1 helix-turn-helix domain-containing protein [Lysobacter sp. ISL-52]
MSSTHLSTEQLAARWDVTVDTIERWRSEGIGPRFLKVTRAIRYRLSDVEAFEEVSVRSPQDAATSTGARA